MAKTLAEKMFLKPAYSYVMLHIPQELQIELGKETIDYNDMKEMYDFILAFYKTKIALENEIVKIKHALSEKGLLWIAYPKSKALQTDLNRDILHQMMKDYGLDGISLVSLNETWSTMRFKKV